MPAIEVQLRRVSVISSRPFEEIVRRLTATIGHPERVEGVGKRFT